MAAPPTPPRIDELGDRPFSFYPPIINIDHNEWRFQQATWSEILVKNVKSEEEIWIPRTYVGEISKIDEPVMIVGLKREIEFKGGSVWPHERRILAMPANPVVVSGQRGKEPPRVSTVDHLRLDAGAESGIGKMIAIALAVGLVTCVLIIGFFQRRSRVESVEYRGVLQADLGFTGKSDYYDVVRRLGPPDADRWKSETGERQYRALVYEKKDLVVILMGADRNSTYYVGTKDSKWRTVHSVELPGGRNTDSILRSIGRF